MPQLQFDGVGIAFKRKRCHCSKPSDYQYVSRIELATSMEPDFDVEVEIKTRPGFEDVKWAINLDSSDKVFALVTEDNAEML